MRVVSLVLAAAILSGTGAGMALADPMEAVTLRGLDKTTARISTFTVRIGEAIEFGSLVIVPRHCDKRPPEETPESAAFLEIEDSKPGEPLTRLFTGWMFASSPALNALEHPVYDLWVIDCTNEAASDAETSP